jgi:hypothetical protein
MLGRRESLSCFPELKRDSIDPKRTRGSSRTSPPEAMFGVGEANAWEIVDRCGRGLQPA